MFASPFVAEPRAAQLADTQQGDTPQVPRRDDIGFSFTDEEYDAAVKQQGWDAQSSRRLLVLAQSAGVNMDAAADSGAADWSVISTQLGGRSVELCQAHFARMQKFVAAQMDSLKRKLMYCPTPSNGRVIASTGTPGGDVPTHSAQIQPIASNACARADEHACAADGSTSAAAATTTTTAAAPAVAHVAKPMPEPKRQPKPAAPTVAAPAPTPVQRLAPVARVQRATYQLEGSVTSIAVSPDGHFVVAGFGDGSVFLFDIHANLDGAGWNRAPRSSGILLGQIQAKGIITNLLMRVVIPNDGKYAFVGVYRGSTEMVAWRLPEPGVGLRPHSVLPRYTHSDAKLKGFGAACVVQRRDTYGDEGDDNRPPTYRLLCGRGIKNIHVWNFSPGRLPGQAEWTCIYDEKTNGMTVKLLAFSAGTGGYEAISKSDGHNLRVWNLRDEKKLASGERPISFKDIPNTRDSLAVSGGFALGGTDSLVLVRLDADVSSAGNRTETALPMPQGSGGRRRRQMRTIQGIAATEDAAHVLLSCSDGSLMYHTPSDMTSDPKVICQLDQRDSLQMAVSYVGMGGAVIVTATAAPGAATGVMHVRTLGAAVSDGATTGAWMSEPMVKPGDEMPAVAATMSSAAQPQPARKEARSSARTASANSTAAPSNPSKRTHAQSGAAVRKRARAVVSSGVPPALPPAQARAAASAAARTAAVAAINAAHDSQIMAKSASVTCEYAGRRAKDGIAVPRDFVSGV